MEIKNLFFFGNSHKQFRKKKLLSIINNPYKIPSNNFMNYGYDYFDNNTTLGDLNNDNVINVLDIIATVNLILNAEYNNAGDMNQDNTINVLDIVALVNIILGQQRQ